jgi:hypothetical protein
LIFKLKRAHWTYPSLLKANIGTKVLSARNDNSEEPVVPSYSSSQALDQPGSKKTSPRAKTCPPQMTSFSKINWDSSACSI